MKSERNRGDLWCKERLDRPINHIKAKWILYKKVNGGWDYCTSSNWYYNGSNASSLTNSENHGSTPPCGDGEYMTKADTGVKNGPTWYGNPLESGVRGHDLP